MIRKAKEEKGITLIVLIITIILMLILAGVAVSAITADGMPFGKVKNIAGQYNNTVEERQNAIDKIIGEMNNDYIGGGSSENGNTSSGGDDNQGGDDDDNNQTTDDSYDSERKVNIPDVSKLPTDTTKYVTWEIAAERLWNTIPENWYDYDNGQWANIKSTANSLEAYWVWIPRFAYKLPESTTAKEIEVTFIQGNGTTGANGETCYYATDTRITTGGTGLYSDATALAKGEVEGQEQPWIIHPAFWWDNNSNGVIEEGEQLAGIWVGKYESSSSKPSAGNGGGNSTAYQVQIKPGVRNWGYIKLATAFTVCSKIKKTGGVIGSNSSSIDTHLMKNMEWGAVAILSQSRYGIFNPKSATGPNGDGTNKVWNNSTGSACMTGRAGSSAEAKHESSTSAYNVSMGPKASTTGTVYGVYDMAAGQDEHVMTFFALDGYPSIPTVAKGSFTTGFKGFSADGTDSGGTFDLPDAKYYDIYKFKDDSSSSYDGAKLGDATNETKNWNGDYLSWGSGWINRGGSCVDSASNMNGIFRSTISWGLSYGGFRAVIAVFE